DEEQERLWQQLRVVFPGHGTLAAGQPRRGPPVVQAGGPVDGQEVVAEPRLPTLPCRSGGAIGRGDRLDGNQAAGGGPPPAEPVPARSLDSPGGKIMSRIVFSVVALGLSLGVTGPQSMTAVPTVVHKGINSVPMKIGPGDFPALAIRLGPGQECALGGPQE